MKAAEIMSTKVISVEPETPGRAIARLLFKNSISAVPVVDKQGAPIGMVSEGDLMPRNETEREARRDWWLQVLSEGEQINAEFAQYLKKDRTAGEIMVKPIITVSEEADVTEIAELLSRKKIKRVPVVRDGRMVGIVSRADLVKALAQPRDPEPKLHRSDELPVASEKLEALVRSRRAKATPPVESKAPNTLSATAFRELATHFEEEEAARRKEARRLAQEKHHQEASKLLSTHLTEETWKRMTANARAAAQKGDEEFLLLRFPCELCADHGRAINAPDPNWPETLRGMAGEIFLRWKNELRPQGFSLQARVVDFPDGVPGDIGLFLSWGRSDAGNG